MKSISPTKAVISDALAWIAFNALILWLFTIIVGLSGYWGIYEQVVAFIDLIKDCAGSQCSVQLALDNPDTDPVWFGVNLSIVRDLRVPAFFTWLGIVFLQSFFVGHGRLRPWQPLPYVIDAEDS